MIKVARKNVTIERIIEAARLEFTEKGLDAARLESVARRADVTKQLVRYYFRTKDELYRLVFDASTQALAPVLDPSAYADLAPTAAVRRMVELIVGVHLENPGMTTFTLDQGLHRAAQINPAAGFAPQTRAFIRNVVGPILDRGVQAGAFRAGLDPALLYVTIFHLASGCFLMGPAMTRTLDIDFDSPEGVALWCRHVTDFTLAALRADLAPMVSPETQR